MLGFYGLGHTVSVRTGINLAGMIGLILFGAFTLGMLRGNYR